MHCYVYDSKSVKTKLYIAMYVRIYRSSGKIRREKISLDATYNEK